MLSKKVYANGQKVYKLNNNYLIYYYKNGVKKSEGSFKHEKMEGEWIFYRETAALWQIGNFKNNKKHGNFTRYNKENEVEYNENFENGKIIKK